MRTAMTWMCTFLSLMLVVTSVTFDKLRSNTKIAGSALQPIAHSLPKPVIYNGCINMRTRTLIYGKLVDSAHISASINPCESLPTWQPVRPHYAGSQSSFDLFLSREISSPILITPELARAADQTANLCLRRFSGSERFVAGVWCGLWFLSVVRCQDSRKMWDNWSSRVCCSSFLSYRP